VVAQTGELHQQIEDLALRLVVGDLEAESAATAWTSAFEQIRDRALREQAAEIASMAEAVIGAVGRADNPRSVSKELQEGVARLQAAVECQQTVASPEQSAPPPAVSLAQDPELLSDFIIESREHLANMEGLLLTLERNPHDSEALNAVFRGFHTIKGLAGFLELWEMQSLAHEVETVLDRARNSVWTITDCAIDVILQSADYLNRWLAHLEAQLRNQPSQPPPPDAPLKARIAALGPESDQPQQADGLAAMATAVKATSVHEPDVESSAPQLGEAGPAVAAAPPIQVRVEIAEPESVSAAPTPVHRAETMAVRVDTAKLDYLVDMAGEMVIAESLVRNDPELGIVRSPQLQRKIAHLTRITAELQRTAMAMRLVPVGPLFRRMARLVRDLARQFGKQVEMETEGDEIELDRTIVEELADPLMHMVRNALDHGIEAPAERAAQRKSATARLQLKAHHHAGQVWIEINDDGRGLNREAIRAKAIQRGLIRLDEEASDNETYNLIFEPGFSTAAQVTNVSGRGVGMDVVRRHMDKLRGRIEIHSKPGQGASFILKLPLTLAIIDGLVVGVGEERYIMPLNSVREMFRPTVETIWTVKQRAEMALVRGALLPVLRLHRLFQVEPRTESPLEAVFVVAEVEGQRFCVMVDELIGKQEVVIKSLGEAFKNLSSVAGGAILGDGRVGLILDLDRLFKEKHSDSNR
jgi:two-component system chemotaxis sensor kinase CheA